MLWYRLNEQNKLKLPEKILRADNVWAEKIREERCGGSNLL